MNRLLFHSCSLTRSYPTYQYGSVQLLKETIFRKYLYAIPTWTRSWKAATNGEKAEATASFSERTKAPRDIRLVLVVKLCGSVIMRSGKLSVAIIDWWISRAVYLNGNVKIQIKPSTAWNKVIQRWENQRSRYSMFLSEFFGENRKISIKHSLL